MKRWPVLVVAALTALPVVALAHDYWLLPSALRAPPGARISLSLWVGDDFVPDEQRPWQQARVTRFEHHSARPTEALLALPVEGARPLLEVTIGSAGGHLFALERNLARIEMPAERFEHYLHEEGLDAIADARRARGESAMPGRERYTRYLKTFVQAGAHHDDTSTRRLGQTLELVPRDDLSRTSAGGVLRVTAWFRGAPLAGLTVEALSRAGDDAVRRARAVSDARGLATFTLDREGTWLIRATHMVRCTGCADADWESFWTALTFGVCPSGAGTCATARMPLPTSDAGADSAPSPG